MTWGLGCYRVSVVLWLVVQGLGLCNQGSVLRDLLPESKTQDPGTLKSPSHGKCETQSCPSYTPLHFEAQIADRSPKPLHTGRTG